MQVVGTGTLVVVEGEGLGVAGAVPYDVADVSVGVVIECVGTSSLQPVNRNGVLMTFDVKGEELI